MSRRWLLALVVALSACARADDDAPAAASAAEAFRPLAVGDTVPAYAAATLAGDTARIGAGAGAKLTLVNVWATWCATCKEEFADIERITREYGPRGLDVLAVSVDHGGTEKVARFVRAQGTTFTVAHDPENVVQRRLQLVGVPETFLLAADGRVLWRYQGALPPGAAEARAAIERALGT